MVRFTLTFIGKLIAPISEGEEVLDSGMEWPQATPCVSMSSTVGQTNFFDDCEQDCHADIDIQKLDFLRSTLLALSFALSAVFPMAEDIDRSFPVKLQDMHKNHACKQTAADDKTACETCRTVKREIQQMPVATLQLRMYMHSALKCLARERSIHKP